MGAPDPATRLAERFFAWEQRGRGEDRYEATVVLEPPFRYMPLGLAPPVADDTRRTTWLSRLLQGGARHQAVREPEVEEHEPGPRGFSWRGPLVECVALVPEEAELPPTLSRAWIEALAALGTPVAYELVGGSGKTEIRLAFERTEELFVRQTFEGAVPGGTLAPAPAPLARQWVDAPGAPVLVEFCLARASVLPLAWDLHKILDPLGPIAAALASVSGGVAVLQVLFEPTSAPWGEAMRRAVTTRSGDPLFGASPELSTLAAEKSASPMFAAVVRLGVRSASEASARGVLRSVAGTLARFGAPGRNELMPLLAEDAEHDAEIEHDLLFRTTHRTGMLLSSRELAEIVRLPSARAGALPVLVRSVVSRLPAELSCPGGGAVRLGTAASSGEEVWLAEAQRLRHVHIVGASGTGKSTLLVDMIVQDLEAGRGLAVVDVHGDLAGDVLARIPEHRVPDVVVFDPADPDYVVGWNLLEAGSEAERQMLASDLVGVFRRLSTSWGDQMNSVLANAVLAMLDSPRAGTLLDLRRFLLDKAVRAAYVETLRDEHLASYWKSEYGLIASKRPEAPILTRLDTLLRSPLVRAAVAARGGRGLDFRRLLDGRGVLIARLSQGAIGAENAALLGSLLVTKLHQAALGRQDTARQEREPFYLYIDEFHEVATPSMATLFSGVRKYGLGLVVAHQDLYQLRGSLPEVERSVLANAATRICFRVGDEDARKLATGFKGFDEEDLVGLGTGEAVCRVGSSVASFRLRTSALEEEEEDVLGPRRSDVVEASRRRYGTPRQEAIGRAAANEAAPSREETAPESPLPPLLPHEEEGAAGPHAPDGPDSRSAAREASSSKDRPGQEALKEPAARSTPASHPGRFEDLVRDRPEPLKSEGQEEAPGAAATKTPAGEKRGLGRGGEEHRRVQELIQRFATSEGWRAAVEHTLGGGGAVDVSLERAGVRVACEVSISSTPEHELANVRKCLAALYDHVVVVAATDKAAQKAEGVIVASLGEEDSPKVVVLTLERLFEYLLGLPGTENRNEQVIGAYKVRVKRSAPQSGSSDARRRALSDVLAQSMRRTSGAEGSSL